MEENNKGKGEKCTGKREKAKEKKTRGSMGKHGNNKAAILLPY